MVAEIAQWLERFEDDAMLYEIINAAYDELSQQAYTALVRACGDYDTVAHMKQQVGGALRP